MYGVIQLHVVIVRGLAVVASAQLRAVTVASCAHGPMQPSTITRSPSHSRQHPLGEQEDVLHRLVLSGTIVALDWPGGTS